MAVHEKRLRQNPARALASTHRPVEVAVHLADENVALDLLQFVEDRNAEGVRAEVFQVVEEPLKEVCVVFSEVIRRR